MDSFDSIMSLIFWGAIVYFICYLVLHGIRCIKEKEIVIVERLGKFSKVMTPGPNCIIPYLDRTKQISVRYMVADKDGYVVLKKNTSDIISTQNEVMDFPKQYALAGLR